ncbi:MAG: hypothetical protein QW272_05390 [Candidatus Methanomethylicaceae archaeon]
MFYGSYRKVSKVLSLTIESISKSTVHDLSKKVSKEIKYRKCIAIDEKIKNKKEKENCIYWSAIDIDSKEFFRYLKGRTIVFHNK